MMPIEVEVLNYIKSKKLFLPGNKIIVGLSGGPDSVCLLHLLWKNKEALGITLLAAHLDHQARATSKNDVQLCKELCASLSIQFIDEKIENLNLPQASGSKEEYWRNARRSFFEKVKKDTNADLVAIGHHLQDQQENFFIRLIRGATLSGLTGIKPKEGPYIRPLLEINKKDILEYLKENRLDFIIDASNESDLFLRNKIRKIIPQLELCDSRFNQNFLRTLNHLNDSEEFIKKQINLNLELLLIDNKLNISNFFNIDLFLQPKIILSWLIKSNVKFQLSEKFLTEIIRFLRQPEGKTHNLGLNWSIKKKNNKAEILYC